MDIVFVELIRLGGEKLAIGGTRVETDVRRSAFVVLGSKRNK